MMSSPESPTPRSPNSDSDDASPPPLDLDSDCETLVDSDLEEIHQELLSQSATQQLPVTGTPLFTENFSPEQEDSVENEQEYIVGHWDYEDDSTEGESTDSTYDEEMESARLQAQRELQQEWSAEHRQALMAEVDPDAEEFEIYVQACSRAHDESRTATDNSAMATPLHHNRLKIQIMQRSLKSMSPQVLKMYDDFDLKNSGAEYLSRKLYLLRPWYYQYNHTATESIHKLAHKTDLSRLRVFNNYDDRHPVIVRWLNSDDDLSAYTDWETIDRLSPYEPLVMGFAMYRYPADQRLAICPYCDPPIVLKVLRGEYKDHLLLRHGVFHNGMLVENPMYSIDEDCFVCPYGECRHAKIAKGTGGRWIRFKEYLQHVADVHDRFEDNYLDSW